ncbi:VCBS domain-containing protein [Amphritea sp. HPY]|uniref:VCBS domain-containing protein n=1 Tax=Amphritea sp. HPY TaxID=3421652 RepID=UPI003D7D681E
MAKKPGGGGKPSGNNNNNLETISGTNSNDELFGTGEDESILGKGGNDLLIGGGGNDILDGGAGDDILYDGDRDDELIGGKGNDSFYVGGGNNLIDGGSDLDTVFYSGDVRDYTFTSSGSSWSVSYHSTTVDQQAYTETDQLTNVEQLNFTFGDYDITILLDGTNNGPLAIADTDLISENDTQFFDVIANDWDFEDDALMLSGITAVVASDPENMTGTGTTTIFYNQNQLAPGSEYLIEWNPGTDFDYLALGETATVTITYEITDLLYDSNTVNTATSTSDLTLTVVGTNDGPVIDSADLSGDITEAAASAGAQHIGFESLSSDTSYAGNVPSVYEGFTFSYLYEPSQTFLANIKFWETDENSSFTQMNHLTDPTQGDSTLIYSAEGIGLVIESESGGSFNLQSAEFAVGGDYATLLWVTGYNADGNVVAEHKQTIDGSQAYPIAFTGFDNVSRVEVSSQQPSDPTPDDPMSYAEGSRTTILIDDIVLEESTSAHSDSGTFEFTDVDLTDSHTVSVAGNETADYRGLMTAVVNDAATDDTQGQITWTFNIADADLDDLAAGQTLTQSYDITVDDGNGGSATETVVMTITGTNDLPVIESADLSGNVTEATASAGAQHIGFESLSSDSSYVGNVPSVYEGFTFSHLYDDAHQPVIRFWESDENTTNTHINALTQDQGDNTLLYAAEGMGLVIQSESGGSFNFQSAEFAVGGEYATLLWVTGYDADGNVVAEHKQTIDGSQAYPIAFTGFDNVSRVEVSSQQPSDPTPDDPMSYAEGSRTTILIDDIVLEESTSAHSDSGTFEFTDVDLTDSHTVSVAGNETADYRGLMTAVVNDAATDDTQGQITWTFNIADADLDDLAAGQTLTQSYDITVDDGNGGSATETVVMTITGTNDLPVIESADLSGNVTEATASAGAQHIGFESLSSDSSYVGNVPSVYEGFTFSHLYDDAHQPVIRFWESDENTTNTHINALTQDQGDNTLLYAAEGMGLVIQSESGGSFNFQSAEFAVGGEYATLLWVTGYDADGNVVAEHKQTIDGSQAYPIAFTGFDNVSRVEVSSQQPSDPTPDDPMSYAEGSRTTILIDDIVLEESTSAHSDSGTFEFTDVDLTDSHTVSVAGNETADYRGLMTAVVNDAATDDTQGQITWTFNIADADLDDLAAGQTLTQSYDITVDDGNGGSATETVVMTITGTNDLPVIESADLSGNVTEATASAGAQHIGFESLSSDSSYVGNVPSVYEGFTFSHLYDDAHQPVIRFWESDENTTNTHINALTQDQGDNTLLYAAEGMGLVIQSESGGSFNFQSAEFAVGGEYATLLWVTGYDADGNVVAEHKQTIDGSQAYPIAFTGFDNVSRVEVSSQQPSDPTPDDPMSYAEGSRTTILIDDIVLEESTSAHSDSGTFEFTDVDLTDSHTVSVAGNETADYRGLMTAVVNDAATNDTQGQITWTFNIADADLDDLAAGQTLTQSYDITVDDGNGGSATETVVMTITGTNDAPDVQAIDVSGTVTEPTDTPATGGTLVINFEDLDSPGGQTGEITDYNGFTWEGFIFGETDEGTVLGLESRGYKQVALETNSNNIAFTIGGWDTSTSPWTGVKAVISRDSTFNFDSLVLASAFADGDPTTGTDPDYDTVTITGYLEGIEQSSLTVQVDKNDPLTIDLNTAEGLTGSFNTIDTVEFTHSFGWQMVMDNLQFSSISAAPENPGTSGFLTFTDVDLTDRPTATEDTKTITALAQDGTTPLVLTAAQIAAIEAAFSISADPSNSNNGTINWNYVISETEMDFLGEGEVVTAIFTITVTDDESATATQDVTITLTGTNDVPIAVTDTGITGENVSITVDVLANDTDEDLSDTHTIDSVSVAANQGSATIINNQLQWIPGTDFDYLAEGETATVVIDYGMSDNNGGSDSSTLTLTVTGSNDSPVANVDTGSVYENAAYSIDVLANDTDVDLNDTHTVDSVSVPAGQGSATIVNNQVQWSPGTDFDYLAEGETATVVIDYGMSDNNGGSDSSTLTLTVTGSNDAPEIQAVNVTGEIGVATSTSDDIFVGGWNSSAATDSLLNDGSGSLISTTQSLTLSLVRGMDTGDIDGDGDLDIAAGVNSKNTKILFNNGDGTFVEGLSIGSNANTFDVAMGDYDGDGDLDIYNANWSGSDELWLQNEDGTFSKSVQTLGTTYSRSVEAGDVNGDGNLDLVVVNAYHENRVNSNRANDVLLGDGAGNFTAVDSSGSSLSFGSDHSFDVDLGDVDGDGDLDAVVGGWWDTNHVYLNDGDGHFSDSGQVLGMAGSGSFSLIELADLNGDGYLDAVISNNTARDEVWLNDGDDTGNFSFHQYLGSNTDNSFGLALADFDHDGDIDAFINTNSSTTTGDYIWVNDGAGNFDASPVVVGSYSSDALFVIAGDFDDSTSITSTEANGSLTFTDLDLTDRPTADEATKTITSLAQDGTTALALTATQTAAIEAAFSISADPANSNNGTINWDYAISQADMAFLGKGEVVSAIFTITVTDDEGATAEQDVTITLTGSNDAPVAGDISIAATEDGASVTDSFYATDADTTDSHSFTITSAPSEGSVVNNNDGTFTFGPGTDFQDLAQGQTRAVSFSYTATDDSGADNATSETKTVTMTVTGTNDAPTITSTQTTDPTFIVNTGPIEYTPGDEFLVNTHTQSAQAGPSVTGLADGGFVVTWYSNDPTTGDLSQYSIAGQRFDEAGNAVGDEFLVNTHTQNDQTSPSVAALANGGFVVIWKSADPATGDTSGVSIAGQRFDATGNPVGEEFLVNTHKQSDQGNPSVTGLTDGGFVVTWQSDDPTTGDTSSVGIAGQRFDEAGNAVGDEFLVNTHTLNYQVVPAVTGLADSGFVVTWYSNDPATGDTSGVGIAGQRFDATGNPVGEEFLVNTHTQNSQESPSVTGLTDGGYVVTWLSGDPATGDISSYDIAGQQYNSTGDAVGDEFLVNTHTLNHQFGPAVTGLADGGFVVTWYGNDPATGDTSGYGIAGQRFNAAGDTVGDEFLVNTYTQSSQLAPSVTGLANGGFVVTWQSADPTTGDISDWGIAARIFHAEGGNSPAKVVDNSLSLSDIDNTTLQSALVQIGDGFAVGDELVFVALDGSGITGTFDAASGTLTLSGESSLANYQAALQSVAFATTNSESGVAREIQFSVNDGLADSNLITRSVSVDVPPQPQTTAASVDEDAVLNDTLAATDANGTALSFSAGTTAPQNGALVINTDGSYSYTPDADFFGTDTFSYVVSDGSHSIEETVTVTVNNVNDAPTITSTLTTDPTFIVSDGPVEYMPGDEFLVNTHTLNDQEASSVTGLSDGGFVVTWHSTDPATGDTSSWGIAGQRFNAAGDALGEEFLVNTHTQNSQVTPTVTGLADGGFVVTWYSEDPATGDTSGWGIAGQRFNATGDVVGDEFLVNTHTLGNQYTPSVTGLADGGFVVTWRSHDPATGDTSGTSIAGQRFNAAGDPMGNEFLVNTHTQNGQYGSSVTGLNNGGFVVTWFSEDPATGDTSGYGIAGQRFNAAGDAVGDEFLANTHTLGNQYPPSVTGLADGGFVVTWQSQDPATGDTSGAGIAGQRFNAAGDAVGEEFLVNTHTQDNQYNPSVTGLTDGGFVVTWVSNDPTTGDTSYRGIAGQRFDAAGDPVGNEFLVNTHTQNDQFRPSVTGLADGGFVVTWYGSDPATGDTSQDGISARIFHAEGGSNPAVIVDSSLLLADIDNATLHSALIQIGDGFAAGDELVFVAPDGSGITGTFDAASGTLTLTGESSLANYQAALQSVAFATTNSESGALRVIQFSVNDGLADSNLITRSVSVDVPPQPQTTAATVDEDTVLNDTLAATDANGTALSFSAGTTVPQNGALLINSDGSYSYTPDADFFGTDTFSYLVSDGSHDIEETVTVTVNNVNDAPVAGDVSIAATEDGASVTDSFYATDADTTDTHSFAVTSTPAEGSLANNNDGSFTFDPGTDFQDLTQGQTRDVSFSYTATDDSGADNATSEAKTITVTVTGTNDTPVVKISNPSENFTGSVTESDSDDPALNAATLTTAAAIAFADLDVTDTNHSVSVDSVAVSSGNAGSLDNATLLGFMSANTTGAPSDGIDGSINWSFAAAGNQFDYLDQGETLELTYTLELSDEVDSTQTEVTITVTGAGDIPVLTNSVEAQSGFVGDSFTVTLPTDLFTDHDEGGSVSYTAALDDGSPLPGWLSLNETTYELSGTPGATDSGLYNINVTATEDDGQQSNYVFTLTVLDGSVITGTIGNDNLTGTINGDFIQGLAGNDTLRGATGADLLEGGEGSDFLYGEAGDDVLTGGLDTDYDSLYGGDGNDTLTGGEGGSYLQGDDGDDVYTGGSGTDNIYASTDYGYTETIDAGAGNDFVYDIGYTGSDMVNLGSGDDYVRLYVGGNSIYMGTPTLTLGAGQDEVDLYASSFNQYAFVTITDFEAGADGDFIDLNYILNYRLTGWDGSVNPFNATAGFFKLMQAGTDTLLQIDTNGDGDNYVTAVVFENVDVSNFTADNFSPAYPPDGSVPSGETIEGTAAGETLYGTIGADTIDALEGNDWVYGGSASDTIDGGQGIDYLYGEAGDDILTGGNDTDYDYLYGGDGNDTLTGGEGGSTLQGDKGNDVLTGGSGADNIYADTDSGYTETIDAGAGNDRVYDVGYYGSDSVDLGSGDDYVRIRVQGNSTYQGTPTLTLGTGQDEVDFLYSNFSQYAFTTITDFETGAGGDIINLDYILNNRLTGWDGSVNPFNATAGFLQLIQSGTDTLLQIDTNGSGDSYMTAVVFENVEVSSFTSDNFSPAWPLNGSVQTGETIEGTAAGETLYGTIGADTIDALEGNDWIYGGFSSDTIDGGQGNDYLYGEAGDDILTGGNDTDYDYLYGGDGNDTLTGGEGGSTLRGNKGDDVLTGGSGADNIYADTDSGYTETIDAGAGNDRVYEVGYYGDDMVDLGSGDDYVSLHVAGNSTYQGTPTLTLGAGQDEVDLFNSYFNQYAFATITDFEAGDGGDIINLNYTLNSRLTGWDGASSPFASGYMKLIQDGDHALLQIDTNGGGDSYVTAVVFENVDVNSFTTDNFSPAFPPDGSGIFGTTFTGTLGNDVYDGTIGDDSITGGAGEDTLSGGNGNDSIDGGIDNDTIDGSFGNDTLAGGGGDDQLSGGDGKDTFVFSLPVSLLPLGYVDTDTINDFNIADGDTINLTGLLSGLSGLSETGASLDPVLDFSFNGSATVLEVIGIDANGDGYGDQSIVLSNVDLTDGSSLSDEQIIDALFAGNNLDIFS